jgi:hypothetical protein
MNKTMVMNILTPLIASLATYLASKVPLLDQATWNTLISTVAVSGVTAALAYINRPLALKDTVGNMDFTKVVTDKKSADALPKNDSVVASTPGIEAEIRKASAS